MGLERPGTGPPGRARMKVVGIRIGRTPAPAITDGLAGEGPAAIADPGALPERGP